MAFVDLKRDVLVLKVVLAGPPAVGKTERLAQLGLEGRSATFSMTALGPAANGRARDSRERPCR